jgi:peptidoglycan hydrolase-like protein with peptidoglycan-binding domain
VTRPDSQETPAVAQAPGGGDGDGLPPEAATPRQRHLVRTSAIVLAAAAVTAGAGIAATGVLGGDGGSTPSAVPSGPAHTAEVEKATLTRSETVDGTLGYGDASSVQAESDGRLTWLPSEGHVIKRGETVYSVNEDKVPLLVGSTPLYRTLNVGAKGKDVEMLEENLAALGYSGFDEDKVYTYWTSVAVRAWQKDLGRQQTGTVAPGDAVVASGAKRVAEVKAALGNAASGEILTWTGTKRLVTVDLEAQYEDLVEEDSKVTVMLPDGTQAKAAVADIGNAATAQAADGGGSGTTTIPVTLSVKKQKELGRYQAAPVDVTLAAESREDVLAVPVNALVARNGGGYAVQAVTARGVEDRPVELGLFADGMVEISGDGITEGMKVGIPQ